MEQCRPRMLTSKVLYGVIACFAIRGVVVGGIGKHGHESTPEEKAIAFLSWYVCELLYGPLAALIRTSIALFLLRLKPRPCEKWLLYSCLGIVYIFTAIYFFLTMLQCNPPSYFWAQFNNSSLSGSCSHPKRVPRAAIAHSVIAALSDWLITFLSVWRFSQCFKWQNHIHRNRNLAIMILLSFGSL